MRSTRAKAYINESLTIEFSGAFGVPHEDAIRAVEIAESDMLLEQCDRHRGDLQFLGEMLERFDRGERSYVRQQIADWIGELERKISDLKQQIDA